jgi:hypothetical protein
VDCPGVVARTASREINRYKAYATMAVYLRTGPDAYQAYTLEGGP